MTTRPSASTPPTIDIEWLAQNCYIDFAHENHEYGKLDSEVEEANGDEDRSSIISYRICEVCYRSRPDWMNFHCYMNNGKDRQTMTMCMQLCYHDYQQRRYELLGSGKPTGVIAISARNRVEDMIMTTLRKMHSTADNHDGDLIYDAVALAYVQSPVVHEYFHKSKNKICHYICLYIC
jgi:hypothetical protein